MTITDHLKSACHANPKGLRRLARWLGVESEGPIRDVLDRVNRARAKDLDRRAGAKGGWSW